MPRSKHLITEARDIQIAPFEVQLQLIARSAIGQLRLSPRTTLALIPYVAGGREIIAE